MNPKIDKEWNQQRVKRKPFLLLLLFMVVCCDDKEVHKAHGHILDSPRSENELTFSFKSNPSARKGKLAQKKGKTHQISLDFGTVNVDGLLLNEFSEKGVNHVIKSSKADFLVGRRIISLAKTCSCIEVFICNENQKAVPVRKPFLPLFVDSTQSKLIFKLKAPNKSHVLNGKVSFICEGGFVFQVNYLCRFKRNFFNSPSTLDFGPNSTGAIKRRLKISSSKPFEIFSYRSPQPGFVAQFKPDLQSKSRWEVEITYRGKVSFFRSFIEFSLSEGRKCYIPVYFSKNSQSIGVKPSSFVFVPNLSFENRIQKDVFVVGLQKHDKIIPGMIENPSPNLVDLKVLPSQKKWRKREGARVREKISFSIRNLGLRQGYNSSALFHFKIQRGTGEVLQYTIDFLVTGG